MGLRIRIFDGGEHFAVHRRINCCEKTIDGFEVLSTIKNENLASDMKIIVLSNQGQQSDIEKATELGAHGYIIKASAIPSEVFTETLKIIEAKS